MDLRKKIGLAVEAAEPPRNGQAPGTEADEPLEAGVGAARKLKSHRRLVRRAQGGLQPQADGPSKPKV
jgi:hypothetical protein